MSLFTTKRVARDNSKLINEAGAYLVTITGVEMVTPAGAEAMFHDGIQQCRVTGTNAEGKIISRYFNEKAFAKFEDLTEAQKQSGEFTTMTYEGTAYVINRITGKRLPLHESHKSAIATHDILDGFINDCGVTDVTIAEIIGAQCVFVVGEKNGYMKVLSTRPAPAKANAKAEF